MKVYLHIWLLNYDKCWLGQETILLQLHMLYGMCLLSSDSHCANINNIFKYLATSYNVAGEWTEWNGIFTYADGKEVVLFRWQKFAIGVRTVAFININYKINNTSITYNTHSQIAFEQQGNGLTRECHDV